jgi:signal transduction histidine kinase
MTKNIKLTGKLKPRPYARLLTMIGEQLIKNEQVALIEIIKNSYDADASWVQVRFINFEISDDEEDVLVVNKDSRIEIEDDGEGMNLKIIKEAWMNPAAPFKLLNKIKGTAHTVKTKRIIQGEKGIGRYATFKLGKKVEIITKQEGKKEIKLTSDLTVYDDEILYEKGKTDIKYLDELEFDYEIRPNLIHFLAGTLIVRGKKKQRENHGTIISITNLSNSWSKSKIENIFSDVLRIESPFADITKSFLIDFTLNGKPVIPEKVLDKKLESIFDFAPVKVTDGIYNGKIISFLVNNSTRNFELKDLLVDKDFNKRFGGKKDSIKIKRLPECGPFSFEFYIFDLSNESPPKFQLDRMTKDFVKDNRIFLYRDGIRVFPYGDPDDDWLGIDVKRGISRAGAHLSNDQTIGRITISGIDNPKLKDKTNREGLLEIGNSYEDFKTIIKAILGVIHTEYQKYKSSIRNKNKNLLVKSKEVLSNLNEAVRHLEDKSYSKAKKILSNSIKQYEIERKFLLDRAETSEDLASVGLAVEIASHDLMMMAHRATNTVDYIFKIIANDEFNLETLRTHLEVLRGQVSFVEDKIEGIQPIFKSSKRKRKDFRLKEIVEKIKEYFLGDIYKYKIKVSIQELNVPLVVKSNEAVLLQTFINLFDNAIYWLSRSEEKNKEIKILLDGNNFTTTFSDNGPGVQEDDIEFIFEAFFTTKGIDGRGLGLYITDQLLQRYDHSIEYMTKRKPLPGANFLINFSNN